MAKLHTAVDPFNQTTLNTTLWFPFTSGGATLSYASTGAQVTFPASSTASTDGDLSSNSSYDLSDSYAFLQVLTVPSAAAASTNAELRIQANTNNWFRWVYEAGFLYAQRNKAGTKGTLATLTYNATTHKYWKISESAGVVTWWTSPDGITWTSQATYTHGMTISAMFIFIIGLCFANQSSPGAFKWNNFNVGPTQSLIVPLLSVVSALFAPYLTPLIGPPLIDPSSQIHLPVIGRGPVSLIPPLLGSDSQIHLPVIGRGPVSLIPPLLGSDSQVYAPSVGFFSLLFPPFLDPISQVFTPVVSPAAVSLIPPLLGATSQVYAPLLSQGPLMIAPPLVGPSSQVFTPSLRRAIEPNELLLLGVG